MRSANARRSRSSRSSTGWYERWIIGHALVGTSAGSRGLDEISEDETIELQLDVEGIAQPPKNSGWWLTCHGGRAQLSSIPGQPTRIAVTGKRAGPIVVHAVCGRLTTESAFRIRPTTRQNVYALASKLRLQNLTKILK